MDAKIENFTWPAAGQTRRLFARPGMPDALVHPDRIVFSRDLVFLRIDDNFVVLQPAPEDGALDLGRFLAKAEGLRSVLCEMEIEAIIGTAGQKPRHRWTTRELNDPRGFAWSLLRAYFRDGFRRQHARAMEDLDNVLLRTVHDEHAVIFRDLEAAGDEVARSMQADGINGRNLPRLPKLRAFFTALGQVLQRINANFRHINLPEELEQTARQCYRRHAKAA